MRVETLNLKELQDDNIYTINAICKLIGCNRRTAEKYLTKGNYPITSKSYNGLSYTAFVLTPDDVRKLEYTINANKGGVTSKPKTSVNTDVEAYTLEGVSPDIKSDNPVKSDVTEGLLRNVKELSQENNELKTKIKDLETEKLKIELEKSNVLVEFTKANEQIKYITDKQTYIEGVNSQLNQDIKQLNRAITIRNTAILVLGAIILVVLAVGITLMSIK